MLGEVMVSLTPMMGEVKPFSWIMFTCSYKSSKRLHISFKLSPYRGAPLTATSTAPGPIVTTEEGAYRTWHVYVQQDPCNVECFIQNNTDKELIRVVTAVLPGLTDHRAIQYLSVIGERRHHGFLVTIRNTVSSSDISLNYVLFVHLPTPIVYTMLIID